MNRACIICQAANANYKCPICVVYYCSVTCCNKHRMDKCDVIQRDSEPQYKPSATTNETHLFPTGDTVSPNKLQLIANSQELKDMLSNQHLCALLSSVNDADNAETAMANAMQVPIFVEFANTCLSIVDNVDND